MNKYLLLALLSAPVAAESYLVIPAHYWGSSEPYWQPTRVVKFYDFRNYSANTQCGLAARSLHKDPDGPAYSFCCNDVATVKSIIAH